MICYGREEMVNTRADRFAAILELYDFAIRQMRANLRRRHPDAPDAEIAQRLEQWVLARRGADLGDGVGRSVNFAERE